MGKAPITKWQKFKSRFRYGIGMITGRYGHCVFLYVPNDKFNELATDTTVHLAGYYFGMQEHNYHRIVEAAHTINSETAPLAKAEYYATVDNHLGRIDVLEKFHETGEL